MEAALPWASHEGYAEAVRLILGRGGVDINMYTSVMNRLEGYSGTPLTLAVGSSLDVVQLLLEQEGININIGNPLFSASANEYPNVVQLLLQRREIEVNEEESLGSGCSWCDILMTPLGIASALGNTEILQLLLEHPKTDVEKINHPCAFNQTDDCEYIHGYTTEMKIAYAIDYQSVADSDSRHELQVHLLVQSLLGSATGVSTVLQSNKTLVNINDNYGRTPLFWAATRNHIEVVVTLLNYANILVNRGRSIDDATALFKASEYGHKRIVRLLLDHPTTDANYVTLDRKTPLMVASLYGEAEVVEMLLSVVNINVNSVTFDGKTALIYAASAKQPHTLELLLRCPKTDTSLVDEEYKTALDRAKDLHHDESIKRFQSRGSTQIMKGHTCCSKSINRGLHIAIKNEDLAWMGTFLVCPDIEINMRNNEGSTPLNLAIEKGLDNMVEVFLSDQRIDVNKQNTIQKQNALLIASEKGHINILEMLLLHPQTFANQENANGDTALINKGTKKYGEDNIRIYYRIIKLLLRCPKVDVPEGYESSYDRNYEYIKQALELRSVSKPTCCLDVRQSILTSAWIGDFRAIRGLLTCPGSESNINVVDNKGRTPLYIASMRGHLRAVEVLLKHKDEDVNIRASIDGSTAFSISSEKSHFEVMKALIVHGHSDENRGWCSDNWVHHTQLCNLPSAPSKEISTLTNMDSKGQTNYIL